MKASRALPLALVITATSAAAQRPNTPAPESIDVGGGVGLRVGFVDRGAVASHAGLPDTTGAGMLGLTLRANKLLGRYFVAGVSTVGHFHLGGPEGAGLGDWSPVLAHLRFLPAADSNPPRQGFYLEMTSGVTLLLLTRETVSGASASLQPASGRSIAQPSFSFGFGMGGRWKHFELGGSLMINAGFETFALSFGMQALFYLPAFPWESGATADPLLDRPSVAPIAPAPAPQAAPQPAPPPPPFDAPVGATSTATRPEVVTEARPLPVAAPVEAAAEGRFARPVAPAPYTATATAPCEGGRASLLLDLTSPFDGHPAGRQLILRFDRLPRVSVGQRATFTGLRRLGSTSEGLPLYCGTSGGAQPAAPEVRKGKLRVTCAPIGVVSIDGEQAGTARPTLELDLPAGPHTVTCTNPELGEASATIEVRAEQTIVKEFTY